MDLDEWTLDSRENLFDLELMPSLPYEGTDNFWINITIERDLSLTQHERAVYTLFDFLSDIGGLSGILLILFAYISSIWSYNQFDTFIVSRLFKIKKP